MTYPDIYVVHPETSAIWGFAPHDLAAFEAEWRPALTEWNGQLCETAEANGAVCIRTQPVFNGPDGDQDAGMAPAEGAFFSGDHVHFAGPGDEAIARAIADVGFAPLDE